MQSIFVHMCPTCQNMSQVFVVALFWRLQRQASALQDWVVAAILHLLEKQQITLRAQVIVESAQNTANTLPTVT